MQLSKSKLFGYDNNMIDTMTHEKSRVKIEKLKVLVQGFQSGDALITKLENSSTIDEAIVELFCSIISEATNSKYIVSIDERISLDGAKSVINQLPFLNPR